MTAGAAIAATTLDLFEHSSELYLVTGAVAIALLTAIHVLLDENPRRDAALGGSLTLLLFVTALAR